MNRPNTQPSRVAFITDAIAENHTGVGRYASNALRVLQNSGNTVIPVDWRSNKYFGHLLPDDNQHSIHIPNRWPFFKTLFWHMDLLPSLERFAPDFDLAFNPSQFMHLTDRLSVPYVYVVHDLSFFSFPECHKHGKKILFGLLFEHTLRKANCIVCVSEYTKSQLMKRYPKLGRKTSVVYEAAEEKFKPIKDIETLKIVRKKYHLPEQFLLFVGTVEPRKNLDLIIRAYGRFRERIPYPFYVAGKLGWKTKSLFRLHEKLELKDQIRFLGHFPDEDLPALYNLATSFVYVSKDEGFGLPPLEAMQCGTPVVVSNAGSLPEIAGDAALITSAYDSIIVGKDLITICKDETLRERLRQKGFEQSKKFTWKSTGERLIRLFGSLTDK